MLPPLLDRNRPHPADKWLWAMLIAMVIGQLFAFWMLCQDQVRKAEVRDAQVRAQNVALRDDCAPRQGRATCLRADVSQRAAAAPGMLR